MPASTPDSNTARLSSLDTQLSSAYPLSKSNSNSTNKPSIKDPELKGAIQKDQFEAAYKTGSFDAGMGAREGKERFEGVVGELEKR